MGEFNFTKKFIFAYAFTYTIALAFSLPLNFIITSLPSVNIVNMFFNIFIFIINFITFSTDFVVINIILWICRFIVLLEMLPLIVDLMAGLGKLISGFFI